MFKKIKDLTAKIIQIDGKKEVVKTNCPKCGAKPFPEGSFFITPIVNIGFKVKIFIWIPIGFHCTIQYDPNCGELAIRNISL